MNQHPGVIGYKLGMTQIFSDDGSVVPCSVVEARPVVIGKRTQEKDGYDALVLGTGTRKEKLDDDLDLAKSQLDLHQNEVTNTRQELIRIGGDPEDVLEQKLEAHRAAVKSTAAATSCARP